MTIPSPLRDIVALRRRAAWTALDEHAKKLRELHLRQLFSDDPGRAERFTVQALGLYFDYSKHRITSETIALLIDLANQSGLRQHIDAMFSGEKINVTEQRAVLHIALRAAQDEQIFLDGKDVVPDVHAVLARMATFAADVRSGGWKGHTGKRIRNVINIGIGGSDLGPVMAYEALKYYSQRDLTFRFVSNVDGTDFVEATRDSTRPKPVHRFFQDVHHAGDDDQRPQRARVGAGGSGRRQSRGAALRGGLHQRRGSAGVRHRHRQHVRLLGLGRRTLFDGLRNRAFDHDRHRRG